MLIDIKNNTLNLQRYRALDTTIGEKREVYSGYYIPITKDGCCSKDYLLVLTYDTQGLTFELHEIDFDTIEREE